MTTSEYTRTMKRWTKIQPTYHQRTLMSRKCRSKCFLGTRKSFPICNPKCNYELGGVQAAYIRAREMAVRAAAGKTKNIRRLTTNALLGVRRPCFAKNIV